MIQVRPLLSYLAKAVFILIVLVSPWPGLGRFYPAVYQGTCNVVYRSFGPGRVRFEPLDDPRFPKDDTSVSMTDLRTGRGGAFPRNSRNMGYLPTSFVVALILATPFPWRRRLITLGVGLVVVTAYVVFRQFFFLMLMARNGPTKLFDFGPTLSGVLDFGEWVFVRSFTGLFVVPVVIWIAVSFRRRDFDRLIGRESNAREQHVSKPSSPRRSNK